METIYNSMDVRRQKIAAVAEAAATEAVRKKVNHMMDFMTGFNDQKLRQFLAFSVEDREGHLAYLETIQTDQEKVCFCPAACPAFEVDLTTQMTQAYVGLLEAADSADQKQIQMDRAIEALMADKQSETHNASEFRKEALKYKKKLDNYKPKIAKLSTFHDDLVGNKEVMDLPRLPTYNDVKSSVGITDQDDLTRGTYERG
jgi:hypothetical protein